MKRILLLSITMLMGIASFAQKKGDLYVSGSELYTSKLHTSTWGGYINILEFEFKVSEKFSIGANAGGLGVYSTNYAYSADEKYRMNQFVCDFTHGGVDFKFYF